MNRSDGAGTCCPLTDAGTGKCEVKGTDATCTFKAEYKDSGKTVKRSGTATLALSGNTIAAKFHIDEAEYADSEGKPCAGPIETCTGLHPGAESTGYWTRKP